MSVNTLDGDFTGASTLDNESEAAFSTLIVTSHPNSVLRTDASGVVGGLGLTAGKRPRVTASGDDLEVADIDGSEIATGTVNKDRLPLILNAPLSVTGASNTLSELAITSAVGDYGRLRFGTSGSGSWFLEKDTSGNLLFYKGVYGSATNYWSFLSDGSATMRPATVGANVTTQIAMGIPSSTQYGQVLIQYQSASVPGGADDQIVFRGVQNGIGDALPICRFQRTGITMRKPTSCNDGLTIFNDLICSTTCIANFQATTNQLRFRSGGGGNSAYFNVSQPASASRVINFIDPGAANRTVLYTDLAQACTLGAITSDGTISFTGSSITLGNASSDTLTVNATTTFTAPVTYTTITASTATLTAVANQLVLGGAGGTNTITLSAPTPGTSRTVSFADPGAANRTLLYTDAAQAATLGVVGSTSLTTTGAVSVGTTLGVTGTSTLAAVNASSLSTTGSVSVGTTLGVTGTSTLATVNASSLTTTGAVSVGTTLGVTGTSTLAAVNASSLTTTGAVSVGTTLGVTGTSTLATVNASSLATTGAATVGTTLGVTGTSTLATVNCTALTASGAVSFTRSAGPQLTIPGGADPSTSEVWLGTDATGTAQWRILQASLTYGNKLIFRSSLGGSTVDQLSLTPTTTAITQPLGVGGAANTSYKLYVQGGASNFSNSTTVPASSVLVGNFSSTFGTVYSANSDPTDSGRWIQLYNSNATTTAGIQVCQSFHIIGGSIATRVINDLKAIRETVNQPNGAFVLTGRTNATGSILFRDYAYFGYNKAFISPGAGNPITIGSQTTPTSGYQVAIGTAGGTTDGSLEVNGNMIVRGAVAAPFTIEGSSTSTFVVNTDIGDSLRFARITNTSTDTTAGVMSGLSFRVGPTGASPVQCDLVVSRDGASTRGGFSLNSKDASSGTGYWTMASFTPRLISITPDWAGYGSHIAGITLNSRFVPSAGYAVAIGSPGSYNTDGALEVAGNALFRGTLDAQGTTLSSLTVTGSSTLAATSTTSLTASGTLTANGNVILGDATSDTVTINGDTTCTYKLTVQGTLTAQAALTVLGRLTGSTTDYANLGNSAFWPVNDSGSGYNTWKWRGNGGVQKTSVAAATQKVIISWTGSWTAPGASKHAGISFKDIITCTRHSTGEICRSEVVWCMSIDNTRTLVSTPSSIIATSTTASGSQVVGLSFAFTNVSGSTYTASATYTLNNISITSNMDMDVESDISARQSILTAVTGYSVTSST